MNKRFVSSLIVGLVFSTLSAHAAGNEPVQTSSRNPYHPCLAGGVKQSIVFLGIRKPSDPAKPDEIVSEFVGTASLVNFDDIIYLITAKHVIQGIQKAENEVTRGAFFLNDKNGKSSWYLIRDLKDQFKVEWVMSGEADIATIPFAVTPEFDVKTISESFFLPSDNLLELQDIFFISYQPGIGDTKRITPVMRKGMISIINDDRYHTFYADAFAFPGNSGSPVFVRPAPITFTPEGASFGDPSGCKFVGVIGEYLTYQEPAVSLQTLRPRVIFEENTGLARVWTTQAIESLFKDSKFVAQHQRLKKSESGGTKK